MPRSPTTPSRKKRTGSGYVGIEDELESWRASKQLAKPKDQVELADAELKEIISRNLVLTNPLAPQNIVEFSYFEGCFVDVPQPKNYVVLYQKQGCYIHKSSEEARQQYIEQGLDLSLLDVDVSEEEEEVQAPRMMLSAEEGEEEETLDGAEEEELEDEQEERVEKAYGADAATGGTGEDHEDGDTTTKMVGKLKNQFNYCERAGLSVIPPFRPQETQTMPPPTANFSSQANAWLIFDAYQADYAEQERERERERERKERAKDAGALVHKPPPPKKGAKKESKEKGNKEFSDVVAGRAFESWKVLERMINLNSYDDIAKDYRYWEDPSDEYRDDEGTLLPLWKYQYDKLKDYTATCLLWNPWYYDMFIACFGSVDFLKQTNSGYICLYTIKNPSFPESICAVDSEVMCADIHPAFPYMLVCGLADGNIRVYNIQASTKTPSYQTRNYKAKCLGIVWAVKWFPDLQDGELNFYAVSNDGVVKNYVLMQCELSVTHVIKLLLDRPQAAGPDGTLVPLVGCATTLIKHPKENEIYLVGTEEGFIYKCNVNYSSNYLLTYKAHDLPVYKISYNYFDTNIFISCSGDWRIKIWEDGRLEPLISFDLGAVISDVQWAPYSSTVFAAVTYEGKVYVFDLNLNKYKPVCVQPVVSKKRNKLTTIAFNNNLPIIIVGDDKGCVSCLKLSPNLRIPCKPPKKQQQLNQFTLQCMKLEKLLSVVREPLIVGINEDITTSLLPSK